MQFRVDGRNKSGHDVRKRKALLTKLGATLELQASPSLLSLPHTNIRFLVNPLPAIHGL
jgi:hypothetical protein